MSNSDPINLAGAIEDFRRARQQAFLKEVLARVTGEQIDLLSYEEVRQVLKAQSGADRGLHDIPLAAITGSVNRYTDFTRDFLPRANITPERWARVELATFDLQGLPPIEVYKIGEVYFVKDGNHRVSVARQLGASHIQAYVTEIKTRVPLTLDVGPDELISKAELASFYDATHMDEVRPEADLSVTVPGQYPLLQHHIEVHRYYQGLEQSRFIPVEEAAAHWYDTVYLPLVEIIRRTGILWDFPDRTETDLYLWLSAHRATLEEAFGQVIRPEDAAADLADQFSSRPQRIATRLGSRLLETLMPSSLDAGPTAGQWRREKLAARDSNQLFSDLLVPVNGQAEGWFALEQALVIARHEGSRLVGLHVTASEEQKERPAVLAIQAEYELRCQEAGVAGHMIVAAGDVTRKICDYARWSDLVILNLSYPPSAQPLAALSSGFKSLIHRCPRPVLAVPQTISALTRLLLAYDGSPKAEEALFIATHMAGRWKVPLVVTTVFDDAGIAPTTLAAAQLYLEQHAVEATYAKGEGPVAEVILNVAREQGCDLLLMGGYGHRPVLDMVLGSTVDQILRQSRLPILICR